MIQIPVQAVFRHLEWDEVRVRAFTLAISAHGCLLDMDIKPEQGQRMRLLNAESAAEQSGRVIRVQRTQGGSFAVEFEFDSPAPHLWSIVSAPEDWRASQQHGHR
ncbi:MAG: hypothetical protein WBQ61_24570 [Candidatus Acidiferrum sp.]